MSPLMKLTSLENDIDLYIKRDDLLPFSFGGNKLRIAFEFMADMQKKSCDCMICYGSPQSNLCRVIANLCKRSNIQCHIISPADDDTETYNSRLVHIFDAVIHKCAKKEIAQTLENVMNECMQNGLKPYYIYGDKYGQGNESVPVEAYIKAYREINQQAQAMNINFDYIFSASGTGMTQAGLIMGNHLCNSHCNIVGISIARTKEQEIPILQKYILSYCRDNNINFFEPKINFEDKYLYGGYGKFNSSVSDRIKNAMAVYGLPLDTTYTGKAFSGMLEYLKEKNIRNKNILFVHTGGTPLFFDYLNLADANIQIKKNTVCKSVLFDFIRNSDIEFTPPLSTRVDLESYSGKLLANAELFEVHFNNELVALIAAYANDDIQKKGYITYVYCRKEFRKNGLTGKLMNEAMKFFKQKNYKSIALECSYDNTAAIRLYEKFGFAKETSEQNKIKMIYKM